MDSDTAGAAWSLTTLAEAGYAGNGGHHDVLGSFYSWDSQVHKHSLVKPGHLVVLRDRTHALGLAWIDTVETWTGSKERFVCPACDLAGFKERTRTLPRYRCDKKECLAEFDTPTLKVEHDAVFYRAFYDRTWSPFDVPVKADLLSAAYKSKAVQHAIRELDLATLKALLAATNDPGPVWWQARAADGHLPNMPSLKLELPGGHRVTVGKVRRGQSEFRAALLSRFGPNCAVSGALPESVLEAAHLYRYADVAEHHADGGLLLRRDLHALFDRYLLLIDPDDNWRVYLSPTLEKFPELWAKNGVTSTMTEERRPNPTYLRAHARLCRASW